MPKMSRDKGKRGERKLAKELRGFNFPARRGQQFCGGGDSPDVVGIPGVHIECKVGERPNPYAALLQAEMDCPDGSVPVAMLCRDRGEFIVVAKLKDIPEFAKRWIAGQSTEQVGE